MALHERTKGKFGSALSLIILLALALSAAFGTLYVNDQQNLRLGANEPQNALADQAAAEVAAGQLPAAAAGDARVDISASAAPYVVFYDTNGAPLTGTGYLNGVLPQIPLGVFDVARAKHGPDRITWQPQQGIRQAIVVEPVQDPSGTGAAFVMAGRSLAYTEQQESMLTVRTFLGWLAAMVLTLIAAIFFSRRSR